jgi:hypothetical protein
VVHPTTIRSRPRRLTSLDMIKLAKGQDVSVKSTSTNKQKTLLLSIFSFLTHYLCKRSITTDVVSSNPTQARCTTLCNQVFQWHETGRWFSPCPPVSSTNKTEILLEMALSTITLTLVYLFFFRDFVNRSY